MGAVARIHPHIIRLPPGMDGAQCLLLKTAGSQAAMRMMHPR
jgi:hypothetical protein